MTIKPWIAAVWVGMTLPSLAEPFDDAANALCEKTKMCARASMAGQQIPPDMMAMINQQLDGLCAGMLASFDVNGMTDHPLYQPAVACMESMAALSCDALEREAGTAACDAYQQKLERYGE